MTRQRERGLSPIEVMIATTIGILLLTAVVSTLNTQRKMFTSREYVADVQQDARTAIDFLVRELRLAGYDPLTTSDADILVASADRFQFTADLDADGATDGPDENVTYGLYDTNDDGDQALGRDTGDGYILIAEHIDRLNFVYTLADATITSTPADPSQIRSIDIVLTLQTATPDPAYHAHGGHRQLTLSTRVELSNMVTGTGLF